MHKLDKCRSYKTAPRLLTKKKKSNSASIAFTACVWLKGRLNVWRMNPIIFGKPHRAVVSFWFALACLPAEAPCSLIQNASPQKSQKHKRYFDSRHEKMLINTRDKNVGETALAELWGDSCKHKRKSWNGIQREVLITAVWRNLLLF